MSSNFWQKLKQQSVKNNKPILCSAPMADVTDLAFREMLAKYGKPSVIFTEFVSADGLSLAPKSGQKKLLENFLYTTKERPIVAQIFGANSNNIMKAVRIVKKLGFDGVDVNMGCPENKIVKQGAGAGLIRTPELAKEIILAAKKEANRGTKKIPVSVKTRIGFNKNELQTWLPKLLEAEPAVITIHCRTRKDMSLVPADWTKVKQAVEIRNESNKSTLIFGNGDIQNLDQAQRNFLETGCNGVMVGRGLFGNPFFFNSKKSNLTVSEKLKLLVEHTKKFTKLLPTHNFSIMKKHYKAYCTGFDGAKELRVKLMAAEKVQDVERIIKAFIKLDHKPN